MSSSSACADRLKQLPPALSAWITLLEHWQEEERMSTITDEPALDAYNNKLNGTTIEACQSLSG
jgi:hypothetical protein